MANTSVAPSFIAVYDRRTTLLLCISRVVIIWYHITPLAKCVVFYISYTGTALLVWSLSSVNIDLDLSRCHHPHIGLKQTLHTWYDMYNIYIHAILQILQQWNVVLLYYEAVRCYSSSVRSCRTMSCYIRLVTAVLLYGYKAILIFAILLYCCLYTAAVLTAPVMVS